MKPFTRREILNSTAVAFVASPLLALTRVTVLVERPGASGGVDVFVNGSGSFSIAGATFDVSGRLSTLGRGDISLSLRSGGPSLGGFDAAGTFTLEVNSPTDAAVGFTGELENIPSIVDSIDVTGTVRASGSFMLTGTVSGLTVRPNGTSIGSVWADIDGSVTVTGGTSSSSGRIQGSGSLTLRRQEIVTFVPLTLRTVTLYGPLGIQDLDIHTDGQVSATVTNFELDAGVLEVGAQTVTFLSNPAAGVFQLYLDEPTVRVSGVLSSGTWFRDGSDIADIRIDLNIGADFRARIWNGSGALSFGGFTLRDTDVYIDRTSGVLSLRFEEINATRSNARITLPGNLGFASFNNDFTIASNGTFTVDLGNPTLGSTATDFYITADRLLFRNTSGSFGSLQLYVDEPDIVLPFGGGAHLPDFAFSEFATVDQLMNNLSTSLLDLGPWFRVNDSGDMDFRLRTTSSGWELSLNRAPGDDGPDFDESGNSRFSFMELREFTVSSDGSFDGELWGDARVRVGGTTYTLARGMWGLSYDPGEGYIETRIGGSSGQSALSVDLGFWGLGVTGWMRSNGTFDLRGTSYMNLIANAYDFFGNAYELGRITGDVTVDLQTSSPNWDLDGSMQLRVFGVETVSGWVEFSQSGTGSLGGYSFFL